MRSLQHAGGGSDPTESRGPLRRSPSPIQGDFGNRVLAFERFAASFEIDVLSEALQIICAPTRMCCFPLQGLNAGRLDARSVLVGKIDDACHSKDRQPEHHEERQIFLLAGEPVGESASPYYRPETRFAEQRCEHDGSAEIPDEASFEPLPASGV